MIYDEELGRQYQDILHIFKLLSEKTLPSGLPGRAAGGPQSRQGFPGKPGTRNKWPPREARRFPVPRPYKKISINPIGGIE
jgi:hypothetical protein